MSRSENDSHLQTAAREDARPIRFEFVQMKMSRETGKAAEQRAIVAHGDNRGI